MSSVGLGFSLRLGLCSSLTDLRGLSSFTVGLPLSTPLLPYIFLLLAKSCNHGLLRVICLLYCLSICCASSLLLSLDVSQSLSELVVSLVLHCQCFLFVFQLDFIITLSGKKSTIEVNFFSESEVDVRQKPTWQPSSQASWQPPSWREQPSSSEPCEQPCAQCEQRR